MRKKTHEEFMRDFEEKQPENFKNIEILGEYVNNRTKIKFRCRVDGYIGEVAPDHLLTGTGCPRCSGKERYTTKSFKEKIKEINPYVEVIGEYINNYTKIKCRCLIDGYEWETAPSNLLSGCGCPICGKSLKLTTESFKEKLKKINPNIEVIGEYVNNRTKIKCRCLIDGYEWEATPSNLLCGAGCPRCAHAGESWMDRALHEILLTYDSDAVYRGKDTIGMELDSFCPNLNLAFEPGSWHWHQDKVERDALKRKLCSEKGIRCITIYDKFPENIKVPFEEDCYIYPKDFGSNKEEFFEQMNKLIPKIIGGE